MAAYRWWKIKVTAVDGSADYASFGEIEFIGAGGQDWTTGRGGYATQSGNGAVGSAAAGCDDNNGTECGSSQPLPYSWWVDLGSAQEIASVSLRAQRVVPNRTPRNFKIWGSNNGSLWELVSAFSGATGWSWFERRVFALQTPDEYEVAGTVKVSGVLLTSPRRVRVHRVSDGALLGQADTVDGLFAINIGPTQEECYVLPIDLGASPSDWAPPCARVMSSLIVV